LPTALGEVARQQGAGPVKADQVSAAASRRITELGTAGALDPATLATLRSDPTNAAAISKATSEIATTFGISRAQALTRLLALSPPAVKSDLALVTPYAAALKSANSTIPAADLAYLSAHGATVSKAQKNVPQEWRNWWMITVACQLVFIPFVFVMAGRWDPRKAREDARLHERMVAEELAALYAQSADIQPHGDGSNASPQGPTPDDLGQRSESDNPPLATG
jgi:hypothetical protein